MKTIINLLTTFSVKQTSIRMYWTLAAFALVAAVFCVTGCSPPHPH